MKLENCDLKPIIQSDRELLKNKRITITVGFKKYSFTIFKVKTAIIEIGIYVHYSQLENGNPIESRINGLIDERVYNYQNYFQDHYYLKPSFFVDGEEYVFEIVGKGPKALKLILQFTFKDLDTYDRPIEMKLKDFIIKRYEDASDGDPKLEAKIRRNIENHKKDLLKKEKTNRKLDEKEKRMVELEDEFGFNKPRDKSRYKIR